MTSPSPIARFQLNSVGQSHSALSDSVIRAVIPRRQARHYRLSRTEGMPGTSFGIEPPGPITPCIEKLPHNETSFKIRPEEEERIEVAKLARRREQFRLGQARSQQEQHDLQEQQRLRDTIQCLNLERQDLRLRRQSKLSPFSVVSQVLHFVDTSLQSPWRVVGEMRSHTDVRAFLHTVFPQNVVMGELQGFVLLMKQLQWYSQCFGEPQIELERIETLAPGVLRANTTLHLTITEATLSRVFQRQNVTKRERSEKSLWTGLEGERLCCSCAITFLFDDKTGRVQRVEPCIDLMTPLDRALKGWRDVAKVFDRAQHILSRPMAQQLYKNKRPPGCIAAEVDDMATFDLTAAHRSASTTVVKQQQSAALNTEAACRRQKRKGDSAQPPCRSPRLSSAQAGKAGSHTSFQRSCDKLKSSTCSPLSEDMRLIRIAEWKKARRKERSRVAQAKFQRRKRQEMQGLFGSIKELNRDIKKLETRKATLRKQQNELVQFVAGFYSSLHIDIKQHQLPDARNCKRSIGCSPTLQVLSGLQYAEFGSIESLKFYWQWYRSQFGDFKLSMTSYECLQAGEHLIIKARGDLFLEITPEDEKQEGKHCNMMCPVLQQFEFENGKRVVERIMSEVDLIGGVSSTLGPVGPERILSVLCCLQRISTAQ